MKPPSVSLPTALIAVLGALFIQVPALRLMRFVFGVETGAGQLSSTGDGAATLLMFVIFPVLASLVWIWFFSVWGEPDGWARIGLRPGFRPWRRIAALTGILAIVINMIVVQLTTPVIGRPEGPALPIDLDDPSADSAYFLALFVFAALLAPVFEEVVFRGFIFAWLRRGLSIVPASVLAAVPHAAIHLDPATIPALSVIFVLFAFLYERTGTLWAPILAHCVHNAALLTIAMLGR